MLLMAVLLLGTGAARAEPGYWKTRPPSPFQLNAGLELGLLLVAVPVWATLQFVSEEAAPPHCGTVANPCNRDAVLNFDKPFIYRYEGATTASDIVFPYAMPLVAAVMFLDYGPGQWKSYFADALVVFESVAVSAAITHIVRFSTRRPRPVLYDPREEDGQPVPDSTMSFWSGHVAYLAAFGASTAYIFTLRHGVRAPTTWIMWSSMAVLVAASATLQVFAGDHFVSDVLVGAGVGTGVGLLIPAIHKRRQNLQLAPIMGGDKGGLAISGRF
jgi:membrane-associated phospholipid phosphatase